MQLDGVVGSNARAEAVQRRVPLTAVKRAIQLFEADPARLSLEEEANDDDCKAAAAEQKIRSRARFFQERRGAEGDDEVHNLIRKVSADASLLISCSPSWQPG